MNTTPRETDECITLAQWLGYKGVLFTHLAQETYTRSWNQKRKNKAMGVNSGFPDYAIYVPVHKSKTGKSELVFIEMKRQKGGVTSAAQKEWIRAMQEVEINIYVCKGFDEAEKVLSQFIL